MASFVLMKRSRNGHLFKILSGLVLWNLYDLIYQVGESDCLETIKFVFKTNHVSARQLARCTGKLILMKAVYRNLVRLMPRQLYLLLEGRCSWDEPFKPTHGNQCLQELKFWFSNLRCRNYLKLGSYEPTHAIACDIQMHRISRRQLLLWIVKTVFTDQFGLKLSKYKVKLFEVFVQYISDWAPLLDFLKGKVVKWLFDSQSCLLIIQPGSSKPNLHKEAMTIFTYVLIIT